MTSQRKYLLEFIPIGNSVKVSAIDPDSGVEVSIVGPVKASQADLTQVAVRKLEYVMGQKSAAVADDKGKGILT